MPPKNWMTAAPGAVLFAIPVPKMEKASSSPRPGPGFASSRNRIDLPCSAAWLMPSGVSTPWLMALLRNNTLAGSMISDASGSRPCAMSKSTAAPSALETAAKIGPKAKNPTTASSAEAMPAEKLLTSISKPGLILPSQSLSSCFMIQAASGPMTIAPRNCGCSELMITPMVATTATTPPRTP